MQLPLGGFDMKAIDLGNDNFHLRLRELVVTELLRFSDQIRSIGKSGVLVTTN
jgi:hypothetical protein